MVVCQKHWKGGGGGEGEAVMFFIAKYCLLANYWSYAQEKMMDSHFWIFLGI